MRRVCALATLILTSACAAPPSGTFGDGGDSGDSGNSGDTGDSGVFQGGAVARIEISTLVTDLAAGEQTAMRSRAFDADDIELPDIQPVWEVGDDSIVEVNNDGLVTALAAGSTAITGRSGLITSDPITLTVSAASGNPSVELDRSALTLGVGTTFTLVARARNEAGITADPDDVAWSSDDDDVVSVDAGVLEGTGAGSATITASLGTASATVDVTSIASGTFYEARLVAPDGAVSADQSLALTVETRAIDAASSSRLGYPVTPDSVEILVDGGTVGNASTGALSTWTWDTSGEAEGTHALSARATVGGTTVTSEPIEVSVRHASSAGWTELGGTVDRDVSGSVQLRVASDDTIYVTYQRYGSSVRVRQFINDDWDPLAETTWTDAEATSDSTTEDLNTKYWASTWWPTRAGERLRLSFDGSGRPIAVWSEDGPERDLANDVHQPDFFNDVHARRFEGASGWVFMGTTLAELQPLDPLQTLDCRSPDVTVDASGAPLVVMSCGDIEAYEWRIYLRSFDGNDWTAWAPPSEPFDARVDIEALRWDGDELVIAAHTATGYNAVLRTDGEDWRETGMGRAIRDLAAASDGSIVGVGIAGGDVVVRNDIGGTWIPLGGALDVSLLARVSSARIADGPGGALAVAWHEGPLDFGTIHAAHWDGSGWTRVGEHLEPNIDAAVLSPAVAIDGQGRVYVAFVQLDPSNPDVQARGELRVLRYQP